MVKKKSKRMRLGEKLVALTILAVSGFFLYQAGSDLLLTLQLNNQVNETSLQVEDLEKTAELLTNQTEKLQDPEYVKSYARGAYMFSKDGEQIFHLTESETTDSE